MARGLKRAAAETQSGGGEADADGEGGGEDALTKKKRDEASSMREKT